MVSGQLICGTSGGPDSGLRASTNAAGRHICINPCAGQSGNSESKRAVANGATATSWPGTERCCSADWRRREPSDWGIGPRIRLRRNGKLPILRDSHFHKGHLRTETALTCGKASVGETLQVQCPRAWLPLCTLATIVMSRSRILILVFRWDVRNREWIRVEETGACTQAAKVTLPEKTMVIRNLPAASSRTDRQFAPTGNRVSRHAIPFHCVTAPSSWHQQGARQA